MGEMNDTAKKIEARFRKIKTKNGTRILDAGSGIFTHTTRKKVLGISKQTEPKTSIDQFWWKRRNEVERALIDLDLFIEVAGEDNINQVITKESLAPIIEALLWHPIVDDDVPDLNRAEIAQMLIQDGFDYLSRGVRPLAYDIPSIAKRTILEAVELSHYLVSDIKVHNQALIQRRKELAKIKAAQQRKQSLAESKKEGIGHE